MRGNRRVVVLVAGVAALSTACGDQATTFDTSGPDTVAVRARMPTQPVDSAPVALVATSVETTSAPPTTDAPLRSATFAFTGDTLVHSPLVRQAQRNATGASYDFAPMFARVQPLLSAVDLAVCHLETPVAPAGQALSTAPVYGVPAEIATGLASAGYDRCSTASNHSIDRGVAGIDATLDALQTAGLSASGTARSAEEARTTLIDVNGIRVAHISYTFGLNGLRRPDDEPWRVALIGDGNIVGAAQAAREQGAEVVIVSLHWGVEGVAEPTRYQVDVANWLTASGQIDLIVGHHAHVPQPVEQVNGTWVAYGLGNFLSNMPTDGEHSWPASSQDGLILGVTIDEQPDGSLAVQRPTVTPTWVDRRHGWVIRPVISDLGDPLVDEATKRELRRSLERSTSLYGDFIALAR